MQFIPLLSLFGLATSLVIDPPTVPQFKGIAGYDWNTQPSSGGVNILADMNAFRSRAGLPKYSWNAQLAYNAAKTGYDNKATNAFTFPFHELNPSSKAQVLSPGISDANICTRDIKPYTPFQLVLAGWLCEVPSDRAIGMNCGDASKKSHFVSPPGEVTGHHDIFGTKGYRDVGCFYTGNPGRGKCDAFTGFWICDFS